jgi:hypothetical protein
MLYGDCLMKEALEWFGDIKIGGKIINNEICRGLSVLLAKEELVLQDMTDKLTEIGRCYGMEMNVEKTKGMRISTQSYSVKLVIHQKQLENVDFLKIFR